MMIVDANDLAVGDEIELDIGSVAHGGFCVARAAGRVVFVRYALPGERALVRITEARPGSFCRGEAVDILRADPRRVSAPCAHFGPGGCGGCDWQHASADLQRELKGAVVAEQLQRLAGLERHVDVELLPGGPLAWRGRVRWAVSQDGVGPGATAVGPRKYRSHDVVTLSVDKACLIAAEGLTEAAERLHGAPALQDAEEVALVALPGGDPAVATLPHRGGPSPTVAERVGGRQFTVDAAGFWQAHVHAAETFCAVVGEMVQDLEVTGGVAWDLYGGVGLFAAVLAAAVGTNGSVVTVESDAAASAHAAANLADLRQVTAVRQKVDRFAERSPGAVDIVLLDPPRSGAGRHTCEAIADRRPAAIIYVACDPAALARDTATLRETGYELDTLRAFDAFPQTHHVECIARFLPVS